MKNEGEGLYTTADGQKVYSTENQMTPEERRINLEKRQKDDVASAHSFNRPSPPPDKKQEKIDNNKEKIDGDNVIEFPKPELDDKKEFRKSA